MWLPAASGDPVFSFKTQSSTYGERIFEILSKLGKVEFPFNVDRQKFSSVCTALDSLFIPSTNI